MPCNQYRSDFLRMSSAVAKKRFTKTNINEGHKQAFNALVSGEYDNFALFSCFVNGEPSAAIVAVVTDGSGGVNLVPLFVAVTPKMRLEDHDEQEPGRLMGEEMTFRFQEG
jgi:hypothetical protein